MTINTVEIKKDMSDVKNGDSTDFRKRPLILVCTDSPMPTIRPVNKYNDIISNDGVHQKRPEKTQCHSLRGDKFVAQHP